MDTEIDQIRERVLAINRTLDGKRPGPWTARRRRLKAERWRLICRLHTIAHYCIGAERDRVINLAVTLGG